MQNPTEAEHWQDGGEGHKEEEEEEQEEYGHDRNMMGHGHHSAAIKVASKRRRTKTSAGDDDASAGGSLSRSFQPSSSIRFQECVDRPPLLAPEEREAAITRASLALFGVGGSVDMVGSIWPMQLTRPPVILGTLSTSVGTL